MNRQSFSKQQYELQDIIRGQAQQLNNPLKLNYQVQIGQKVQRNPSYKLIKSSVQQIQKQFLPKNNLLISKKKEIQDLVDQITIKKTEFSAKDPLQVVNLIEQETLNQNMFQKMIQQNFKIQQQDGQEKDLKNTQINDISKFRKSQNSVFHQKIDQKTTNSSFQRGSIKSYKNDKVTKIQEMKKYIISSLQFENCFGKKNLDESLQSVNQNQDVYLLKSVYKNRPPTIFFQYPKACNKERKTSRTIRLTEEEIGRLDLKFKIPGEQPYQCVMAAFKTAGFKRTKGDNWYCLWGFQSEEKLQLMQKFQKVNHYPGCWHIGRKVFINLKDKMWLHLSQAKRKFQSEYNFVPNTYLMQYDFEKIKNIISEAKKDDIFIMKPVASACGRGIKLINRKKKLKKNANYLVSEYIQNAHLINGYKYDLRVYILVTNYDPLKIYMYQDGLCRFATELYDLKKIHQRFSHLTNYSVNKNNSKFVKNQNSDQDNFGSKWSLIALMSYYKKNNIDGDSIFAQIQDIIIKTLITVEPFQNAGIKRNTSFELYGFDVLIDSNLKPWLLEVNVCPSLSASSPLDRKIKFSLISDICSTVGFVPFNQNNLAQKEKNAKIYGNEQKRGPINCSNILSTLDDLNYNNCLEKLTAQAWKTLFEFDEEFHRKGLFQRIFPNKDNVEYYQQFFQYPRFNNILIQKFLKSQDNFLLNISEKESDDFV